MAIVLPAAIAASVGLYNTISGGIKSAKANKMAANTKRPPYNIPQGDYDNVALQQSLASQGLADSSKQILLKNADRGLSSSINAVLAGGGDVNTLGTLYDSYLNGINNVTLANDAQKIKNVNNFVNSRYRLGDQQDKAWQLNEFAPYNDKMQQIAQLKGQGAQQTNAGIAGIATAGMSAASGLAGKAATSNMQLKPGTQTPTENIAGMSLYANKPSMYGVNGASTMADYPATTTSNFANNFGVDISKLNTSDASMVNNILFGNNGGTNNTYKSIYGLGGSQ